MDDETYFARALRRHHAARVKTNRAGYWGTYDKSPRQIGMLAHTPALCSCFACGNSRRFGERSIAELREAQHGIAELLADTCD